MRHKYASDCHNHSDRSPDGKQPVEAMAERAQALGLYTYTLTDHCECNEYRSGHQYRDRVQAAWEAMETLVLPEGLDSRRGIELGQPMQDLAGAEEAVARYPYDFVIGSLHNLRDRQDFYYMDCRSMDAEALHRLLDEYWCEILEMINWGRFDSLGHLTYPLRYIQGEQGVQVDMSRHTGKIDEIFRALIEQGIALEVNTSGLRQKLGETMPGQQLLSRYYELGGQLVTLGSDAHCTEDLGKGIDQGMDMLKEIGFTEYTVYRQRKPEMLPLE